MKEWASKLMSTRHQEAVDSLEYEGIRQESCFFITIDGKKFLAFYIEGESIRPSDKTLQINRDHRAVMESIRIRRIDGELLYAISAPNENKT